MPASSLNAAARILAGAHAYPERPALICDGIATSYGELTERVGRAANALLGFGARPGDRIVLLLNDGACAVAAFLGAVHAGLVPVPLNPRLAPVDQVHVLRDSGATLVVAHEGLLPAGGAVALGSHVVLAHALQAAMEAASPVHDAAPVDAQTPAFWLYSSGTTGRPKGIVHSHANAALAGMFLREAVRAGAGDVVLCTSKMFFAYGLDNAVLGPLSIGATSIQFAGWPGVDEILDAADRHAPVCLLTMPTLYRRLLQLEPSRLSALRSIRFFSTGGERVPDGLLAQWERVTGVPLLVSYGMSETFCNATANFADRRRGAGSIGLPLAGVSCRLLDGDNQPVPAGEPGVLWIRHPALALRYSDRVLTSHAFRDGWLCTGDLCMIDADGFVYHQGRADELLRVAGQWVKPAEVVEAVLADSRLREAVCVVLPDGDGFERLALFVAGHPGVGPADQIAAGRVGTLPRHSQPKWIREVADFPRTATGKVQRFALREALLEELRTARVAAAPNDRK